ncbi:hypothetical protein FQN57_005733 [Myotisia sp. PD_48]|nr:hypothetical protein FQN57_005733 [Myotisia sp. PD_48]
MPYFRSPSDAQEKWRASVLKFAELGFLDQQSRNQKIILALAAPNPEELFQGDGRGFVVGLADYLERCDIVGAKISLHGLNPRPFSLSEPLQSNGKGHTNNVIVCFRGSPPLQFLQETGIGLQAAGISPQLLLNHLNFPNCFRIRSLNSDPFKSFTVRMVSLGKSGDIVNMTINDRQRMMDKDSQSYNIQVLYEGLGTEQFRKVTIHGSGYFSVELEVTFIPFNMGEHEWSGVLMNDSGYKGTAIPQDEFELNTRPRYLESTRVGTCTLGRNDNWQAELHPRAEGPDPCESRARHEVMTATHKEACLQDPFAFLADLLDTSALSWTRFLSFMEAGEEAYEDGVGVDAENRVAVLRNDKQVLDRANIYFDTVLELLDQRESSLLTWPRSTSTTAQGFVDMVAERLRMDFVQLRSRSRQLSDARTQLIQIEMSSISILESKKGLEEATRVGQVTFLAFLFMPMTFISSMFGMNVTTFTNPNPPLWKFFVFALPFTLVCMIIPFWQEHLKPFFYGYYIKYRKWRGYSYEYD